MKKIAIVGSGISGLVAAYQLNKKYDIQVFEKNDYIGGHTATKNIQLEGRQYSIDTGFIVYNDHTYPNFIKLLDELGIQGQKTEMSFSVHNALSKLEYNGHTLNTLFAQRRNLFKPAFWGLIKEIIRFNRVGKELYQADDFSAFSSLGEFLDREGFGDYFCQHYILPMGAAIWSSSLNDMRAFPLKFFIQFFFNHGLLNVTDRPQWYVIPGGSRNYIEPLTRDFADKIYLNAEIAHIKRAAEHIEITMSDGTVHLYDELVMACHSDQALALLVDASEEEKQVLGAIPYTPNDVVLHTDTQLLPKRKLAWAAWNYLLDKDQQRPATVTYNMNILQGIQSPTTFCVTLNNTSDIDPDTVLGQYLYHHPVFNTESVAAQQQRSSICGVNRTHFAGAYWYNGFHEDGVRSALDVTKRLGVEPW